MDPVTRIQIENFFARKDLEFVRCPLCQRPLLKQSCLDRQRRYPPSKVNGVVSPHEKQILCAMSGCGQYVSDGNFRRSNPWKEGDLPVTKPRLSDEQLEEFHRIKRLANAASPLVGAERFND